jgi:dihydropteroate synthase
MPVIEAIRKEFPDIPISADTFRPEVAQIALDFGGVDIINDVSGGLCVESNSEKESKMFEVVAERNAPIIIMHYRGNPSTMLQKAVYQSNNLIEVVAQELEGRISKALDAGIPLWNIVIDPGIGFAKNESHNFEMLSKASVFKSRFQNIPMLIGTSRKGFIGKTVGSNNIEDRDWGTAATVCASIIGGADFIRVHNVKGMSSVCKVGDRLWRNQN